MRAAQNIMVIRGADSTVPGPPGDSSFPYTAYASDLDGTDFTMINNPALNYMAILVTTTELENPTVEDFAGLWFERRNENSGATLSPAMPWFYF